jgi:hypothetical protein
MTMLSPLGRVPKQRPPKQRRNRRVLPALAMLVVLFMAAGITWWKVLHRADGTAAAAGGCLTPTPKGLALDPRKVKVRVYNGTDKAGLAKTVADGLHKRGYAIATTGNDPLAEVRKVAGVGELRYGKSGTDQAVLLSMQFPGITPVEDPRTDAVVDIAVGPTYKTLPSAAQLNKTKANLTAMAKANKSTCAT